MWMTSLYLFWIHLSSLFINVFQFYIRFITDFLFECVRIIPFSVTISTSESITEVNHFYVVLNRWKSLTCVQHTFLLIALFLHLWKKKICSYFIDVIKWQPSLNAQCFYSIWKPSFDMGKTRFLNFYYLTTWLSQSSYFISCKVLAITFAGVFSI